MEHPANRRYNSMKRFVHGLRAREPERCDVQEFLPKSVTKYLATIDVDDLTGHPR